jgi:hypothetical protein
MMFIYFMLQNLFTEQTTTEQLKMGKVLMSAPCCEGFAQLLASKALSKFHFNLCCNSTAPLIVEKLLQTNPVLRLRTNISFLLPKTKLFHYCIIV